MTAYTTGGAGGSGVGGCYHRHKRISAAFWCLLKYEAESPIHRTLARRHILRCDAEPMGDADADELRRQLEAALGDGSGFGPGSGR